MRFIPTRVHGVLDYLVGLLLIVSPWVLGFAHVSHRSAVLLPIVLGVSVILYSLVTDFEWSVVRLLPMPAHLALDVMSGLLLAASPWLFGFSHEVWLPHLVFGVAEVTAGMTTRTAHGHMSNPPAALVS